jgi:hypothetical protein
MTLRIHAPNPIRVGETGNVLVTSDNPGVVSLSYGAGLTGPASVTIEGTREYGNMGSGGDYVARVGSEGNSRSDCTILIEVDIDRVLPNSKTAGASAHPFVPIFGSLRTDTTRRINWMLMLRSSADGVILMYVQSANSTTSDASTAGSAYTRSGLTRFAARLDDMTSTNNLTLYNGIAINAVTRAATTGTMGGTEALVLWAGTRAIKFPRQLTDEEMSSWQNDGTLPADAPTVAYLGGHEIIAGNETVWDSSGNNYDLTDTDITRWQASALHPDYTDTVPVVPYATIAVTAVATTGTTIDATRPRHGVPARASYSERTEVADQCVVTVNDPVGAVGPAITARVKL